MDKYHIDLLSILFVGFLVTSVLSIVFVSGSINSTNVTMKWDTPPKHFEVSTTVEKTSSTAIPTQQELRDYRNKVLGGQDS